MINDTCQTSDPDIYAIGECASWNNRVYGLVAPGYKMAQVAVDHILGSENAFISADMSAKLKLLGVDVGGIGDAHGRTPGARSYVYLDESKEVYKRLIVSKDNKTLLGAVLVGDTSDFGNLLQLVLNAIELPENPDALILPAHASSGKPSIGVDKLPDSAQICSCFDVTKGMLISAINKGCHTVAALKAETKAVRLWRMYSTGDSGAERRAGETGHRSEQQPVRAFCLLSPGAVSPDPCGRH